MQRIWDEALANAKAKRSRMHIEHLKNCDHCPRIANIIRNDEYLCEDHQ